MSKEKLNVARLRKKGMNFEIIIDDIDKAIRFRKGENIYIGEILYVDEIFKDARKGDRASESDLKKAFGTDDIYKVAEIILREGQLEIPVEYRRKEIEQKYKALISILSQYGKDPKTNLPIPPQRVETALENIRVNIRDGQPIEFQLKKILEEISKVLPIKIESRRYRLRVPPKYSFIVRNFVGESCTILKENWLMDGSLVLDIEVMLPVEEALFNYINKVTNYEVFVETVS